MSKNVTQSLKKLSFQTAIFAILAGAVGLIPHLAYAQGIAGVATNLGTQVKAVLNVADWAFIGAGIMFIGASLFRLRQYTENPANTPLKNVLVLFAVGGALLAAPVVMNTAVTTIFGSGTSGTPLTSRPLVN